MTCHKKSPCILLLLLVLDSTDSPTRMAFIACCVSTDGQAKFGTDSEEPDTAVKMKEKILLKVRQLGGQLSLTLSSRNGRSSTGCLRIKTSTTT